MRKGTKMIVIDHEKMTHNGEDVLVLAFKDEYNKPDFDPLTDYELVYPDKIQ